MLRSLAFAYSLFTAEANFYTTAHDPSLHTREKKTRFETPNTGVSKYGNSRKKTVVYLIPTI